MYKLNVSITYFLRFEPYRIRSIVIALHYVNFFYKLVLCSVKILFLCRVNTRMLKVV